MPAADELGAWGLAGASLLGTLTLGLMLRWFLAGVPLPVGEFVHLRHAHSHLGYYGLLFPLMWLAWRRIQRPAPGVAALGVYALAVAASTLGFLREGYGALSIVGSTVVLAIWVWSAWPLRGERGWLATTLPAIWISAVIIPGVAVAASRGEESLAQALVKGFLALLLLGAALPAALSAAGLRPPRAGLWALGVGASALALGPSPHALTSQGLTLLGVLLGLSVARGGRLESVERALWIGLALGFVGRGLGLLPAHPQIAIAGLHYALLGPVMVTLGLPAFRVRPPAVALGAHALALLGLTLAVGLQAWPSALPLPRVAAWSGSALAGLLALGGCTVALQRLRAAGPREGAHAST